MPALIATDEEGPVDAAVAPLVFELKRLGCFEPCWSSEGQLNKDGGMWKVPQLWFYADSMTSIRVLSDVLADMQNERITMFDWQISLTHSMPDTPTPTFSLHPAGVSTSSLALPEMQGDLKTISENIAVRFMNKMRAINDESNAYSDQPDIDWEYKRPARGGDAAD